jgi:hypothetical protein
MCSREGFLPSALELADRFTLEAARRHLGSNTSPRATRICWSKSTASPARSAPRCTHPGRSCSSGGALEITTATTEAACEKLWGLRREFSASLKATGLTKLNEDICVPRSRLVDLFDFTARLQKKYRVEIASFGHAGDGNIHVNIMADLTQPRREGADRPGAGRACSARSSPGAARSPASTGSVWRSCRGGPGRITGIAPLHAPGQRRRSIRIASSIRGSLFRAPRKIHSA